MILPQINPHLVYPDCTMISFIKTTFWKRICSFCDGKGWIKVDHREGIQEHLKCCVCSGKGTL